IVIQETPRPLPTVEEQSIDALRSALADGTMTSGYLVDAYLQRIDKIDRHGPTLRAVIVTAPAKDLRADARDSDDRRKAGKPLGPLD
ncbi:amidase, partial [Escherichia coli]|nr:amidase [Escherichia coli]